MVGKLQLMTTQARVFIAMMLIIPFIGLAQVYKQDFGTTPITDHPFTGTPVIMDQYLSNSVWSNSKNDWRSFNNAPGVAIGLGDTSNSPVITLTFDVAAFKQLSITGFNFWRQRSGQGPQNWVLRVNGIEIGNGDTPNGNGTSTNDQPVLNAVNNLTGTVTVTLSLTNGGGSSATFRLDDFILYGTVTSTCTQPTISSVLPASGPANTQVTLRGTGFTGASAVTLNGTPVTYQVISATEIKLTTPATGTDGPIRVTTNNCQSDPSAAFTYITGACPPVTGLTELFISEVYDDQAGEGGVIEIYNPTTSTVDMSQYAIDHYIDWGNTNPVSTNPLTGMLPPGGIYLAKRLQGLTCNPATIYTSNLNEGFNDNDKLDLLKNGVVIDRVRTPNNTGFSMLRLATATPLPNATYTAAQWNISNNESCTDVGLYSMPGTPQASITAQPQNATACGGNAATFSVTVQGGTGYTYQWKVLNASGNWVNVTNDATYSGAQTATLTVNAATALNGYQYYVQVSSPTCTLISNAATLTVSQGPVVPGFNATIITCLIPTSILTVVPTIGLEYSIDGTNFNSTGIFAGLSGNPLTLYVRDANGCVSTASVTISVSIGVPAAPTYTVTPITCSNPTATITIDPVLGMEYSIDGTNFSPNNIFTGLVADDYTITVRNIGGCTNSAQVTVAPATGAPAEPTYTATTLSCNVTTATITVTPVTGLQYSIDGTTFSNNNVFTGLASGSYTITARDANGCTNTVAVSIAPAVAGPAVPAYIATTLSCNVTTATITVTPVAGLQYSIDGTTFSTNNVFTGLASGSYTITARDANGCTNTVAVTIAPAAAGPAVPAYTATTLSCNVTTATITVTPVTGLQYSIDGTTFSANNVFTGLASGSYTITARDANGCTNSVAVTIAPAAAGPAVPAYTATTLSCIVTTATITVTPVTGLQYSIDGTTFSNNNVFTGLASGSYTITARDANGCTNTVAVTIAPAAAGPAVPAYTATTLSCNVTTATITVTPVAGLQYSIDGTTFSNNNVFTGLASGSYTITARDTNGCTNTVAVTIAPAAAGPAVPAYTATTLSCAVTTATITVTPVAGLQYSIDGTTFSTNNVFTGLASGSYTITARDANGCTNSVAVTIAPAPVMPSFVTFEGCARTNNGKHFIFELTSQSNYDMSTLDYQWKTTGGSVISNLGPDFDVTQYASNFNINVYPIRLSLTITTPQGCTETFSFEAPGTACDIPKGISPNGDTSNEEFDLSGMNVQHLTIFNRYGLEVYHRANYVKEWHGQTDKGDELPTGTYFYVVKTATENKTGWVYINRGL
ncbi:MAG: gliding motility-associated C-terminal domain-containing protein [Bacteroidia bacterium]